MYEDGAETSFSEDIQPSDLDQSRHVSEINTGSDNNSQRLDLSKRDVADVVDTPVPDSGTSSAQNVLVDLEIPRFVESFPSQILKREGYVVSYNKTTKCANWVAWHLTKEHTSGQWSRKGVPYFEDMDAEYPRQTLEDWKINPERYDHGHMCPAADNKWSQKAMEQSFLLTNMCPQNRTLNGGDWQELENKCRDWAYLYNDIYIVCGPLFYSGKNKTIGGSKEIWVPDAFYKVILCMNDSPKAIGFIYPNEGKHHVLSYYSCSVDEVESKSGIDFFYQLEDNLESKIESQPNINEWR